MTPLLLKLTNLTSPLNTHIINITMLPKFPQPISPTPHSLPLPLPLPLPHPTAPQNLPNHQKTDKNLQTLLTQLMECHNMIEYAEVDIDMRKVRDRCGGLVRGLGGVDCRHRSYWRVRSLVNCFVVVVRILGSKYRDKGEKIEGEQDQQDDNQYIEGFMRDQWNTVMEIDRPEYLSKYYLLQILRIHSTQPPTPKSPTLSTPSTPPNIPTLSTLYKSLKKIKFTPEPPAHDTRLWQSSKLVQILVYQYVLIVRKLAQYDEKKSGFLFKRGIGIARALLGKEHRIVRMLVRVVGMRRETDRMIRMDPMMDSGLLSATSQSRPKTQMHKKLSKLLNPQPPSSSTSSHKHNNYTQTGFIIKKLTRSHYNPSSNTKKSNTNRLYTLQQQKPIPIPITKTKSKQKSKQKQQKFNKNQKGGRILHQELEIRRIQLSNLEGLLRSKLGAIGVVDRRDRVDDGKSNSRVIREIEREQDKQRKLKNEEEKIRERQQMSKIIYISENQIELDKIDNSSLQNGSQSNCQII